MSVLIKSFQFLLFIFTLLIGLVARGQENTPMYEDRTFYGGLVHREGLAVDAKVARDDTDAATTRRDRQPPRLRSPQAVSNPT
jgi:hypothetical protein